jgi:hypothetical protein
MHSIFESRHAILSSLSDASNGRLFCSTILIEGSAKRLEVSYGFNHMLHYAPTFVTRQIGKLCHVAHIRKEETPWPSTESVTEEHGVECRESLEQLEQ